MGGIGGIGRLGEELSEVLIESDNGGEQFGSDSLLCDECLPPLAHEIAL